MAENVITTTESERSNIHFYVMVPLPVGFDIKHFLSLYEIQLSDDIKKQIHLYLLPNAPLFVPKYLQLTSHDEPIAIVEKIKEKEYRVQKVQQQRRILNGNLDPGRLLVWERLPKKYKFLPIIEEEYYLYMFGNNDPLAIIYKPKDDKIELYVWKVKKVFPPYLNKKICKTKLMDGALLTWNRMPTSYYWLPCNSKNALNNQNQKYNQQYNDLKNEIKKYTNKLDISVLPLFKWITEHYKNGVPYGTFRNILLRQTKKDMLKSCEEGKKVYMVIFDPDCRSLIVKANKNIFDLYVDNILLYNHKPIIYTSGFRFNSENNYLNRIFKLNMHMNKICQKYLPGSAYFSECNTIIRCIPEDINKIKFSNYNNEIIPIIKYYTKKSESMIIIDDAEIETTIPARMKNISDKKNSYKTSPKSYYSDIQKLSQTMFSSYKWHHHINTALSIDIKITLGLNKHLCYLWQLHCPLLIVNKSNNLSTATYMSELENICENYQLYLSDGKQYKIPLGVIKNNIQQAIRSNNNNANELVDKCIKIARECGSVIAIHIKQWIIDDKQ